MSFTPEKLAALRARFGGANEAVIHDPHFRAVAANVIDDSGTQWVWEVTLLVRYPKDELPVEDIFRWDGESPDLVLITCGGEFDRTARSYQDNIVVYTELVSVTTAA